LQRSFLRSMADLRKDQQSRNGSQPKTLFARIARAQGIAQANSPTNIERNKMASSRHEEKSTQRAEDTVRRMSERTAEQTSRIGQAAADAGEEIARAGANVFQQNAETLQNAWRFGLDVATSVMGRSTDQLGRTLGVSGNEAEQATERSARNVEAILYSTTAATKVMSGISREYFEFVRQQIENTMNRMNDFWRCRTPQDLVAVQSDFVRDTVGGAVESSRRMADMSLKLAGDAAQRITQNIERTHRAA
jgi:phasin family protein